MYIAFKWLLGLCLALWVAMCCVDGFIKKYNDISGTGFHVQPFGFLYKNTTVAKNRKPEVQKQIFKSILNDKKHNMVLLHSVMFLAGAFAVCVFNKKKEIILFTKNKISKINLRAMSSITRSHLKRTAIELIVATLKYSTLLWEILKGVIVKLRNEKKLIDESDNRLKNNFILLKKLKETGEERKNLAQLLIAAIHENKNIRMRYELETMAKSRLERYIENTQKQIKENRSRYVSFQHLYLVTHQENIFLKARINKLTKEKEDAEKWLMGLMNEVYKSKNNELKAYCSRFIVKTRDNLLYSDVKSDIDKFLEKSRKSTASTSNRQSPVGADIEMNTSHSWTKCTSSCLTEMREDGSLVSLVSNAPKLKGLPGEYVWTVKDKNGIIEKLYEYDYATDYDNGDTIKRIRQYSVYFDKDCLLDFSNSRTIINTDMSRSRREYLNVDYPVANENFLTGSEAFRNFLQSNKNIVSSTSSLASPFL